MKYLNLNNNEMKELLYVRKEHFVIYLITLSIISISSYVLLLLIVPRAALFLGLVFTIAYIGYVVFSNRKYLKELIYKQKKVYRGALSFKTISKRNKKKKYIFNVDGHTLYVDKKNFEFIQEGDVVEFHVSSSTKHLFRVEKVL
jgi:hypothetical protein